MCFGIPDKVLPILTFQLSSPNETHITIQYEGDEKEEFEKVANFINMHHVVRVNDLQGNINTLQRLAKDYFEVIIENSDIFIAPKVKNISTITDGTEEITYQSGVIDEVTFRNESPEQKYYFAKRTFPNGDIEKGKFVHGELEEGEKIINGVGVKIFKKTV